jgi:hypothetical protein
MTKVGMGASRRLFGKINAATATAFDFNQEASSAQRLACSSAIPSAHAPHLVLPKDLVWAAFASGEGGRDATEFQRLSRRRRHPTAFHLRRRRHIAAARLEQCPAGGTQLCSALR